MSATTIIGADGPMLVRRSEALRILGVSRHVFKSLVESGAIRPVYVRLGGRAHYATGQLRRVCQGFATGDGEGTTS